MDQPAVLAKDLRFSRPGDGGPPFHLEIPAWRVEVGARLALYGPSGCGKSTLLELLSGALPASDGRLCVGGEPLTSMSDAARRAWRIRQVGFVFQDYPLVGYLDAVENVLLPYRLNPALRLDAGARERARALLAELGLAEKARRRPARLSQGERQRVALARALVTEPKLLLADEPTSGLDPAGRDRALGSLLKAADAMSLTLLVVTHDPALIGQMPDAVDVSAWSNAGGAR